MSWMKRLFRTMRSSKLDREIDAELGFHLEMRIEEYKRGGMPPAEARRLALLRFGNPVGFKERTREIDILQWLESVGRDAAYGLRTMLRSPLVTFAAVLSLALGIGANTALFSVMDALLWKRLPVMKPQELSLLQSRTQKGARAVMYWGTVTDGPGGSSVYWSFSYPCFAAMRQRHPGIAAVFDLAGTTLFAQGQAVAADGRLVSGNFFSVLGLRPERGRLLLETDDHPNSPPAVVLNHPFWIRAFGGDPDTLGRSVRINGAAFTVVGVVSRGFFGLSPGNCPDFFAPLSAQPTIFPDLASRGRAPFYDDAFWWVKLIARRRPGMSAEAFRGFLDPVYREKLPPQAAAKGEEPPGLAVSDGSRGFDFIRDEASQPLWLLMSLACLVLLIACANVANLLLARAGARSREAMVRAALGASRIRLIRQHMTESLLLSVSGGALGLLVANWAGRGLLAMANSPSEPITVDVALNLRILGFASALSVLTGLVFGLLPAVRASRIVSGRNWQSGTHMTPSLGFRRLGVGRLLVSAQVAVSLVLVIVAGLFLRSLSNLYAVPLGFNPDHLLLFELDPARAGYDLPAKQSLFENVARDLRSLPGVEAASWSRFPLVGRSSWMSPVRIIGGPDSDQPRPCQYLPVGSDFRDAMQLSMLLGRPLSDRDNASAPKVAVVNESFASRYLAGLSPIGKQFVIIGREEIAVEIVGVAKDVRFTDLRREAIPMAYLPDAQHATEFSRAVFEVRTGGNPKDLVPDVRRAIARIDPYLPVFNVRSQNDQINEYLRTERILSELSLAFAAVALVLAGVGLYGIVAYSISRRTMEIGVRMALGAKVGDVLRMVMLDSARVVLAGAAIGIFAALAATRILQSNLYGLRASDPVTIAGAAALLVAVSFAAAYFPARRAAHVNPIQSLRYE